MASDSVRLAARRAGAGPTLVLLHGLGLDGRMWQPIEPALHAAGFATMAIDLRGHGLSPTRDADATLDDFADDVLHTLREERVDRFRLVGHSMGGMTAIRVVLRGAPVDGLVLSSTSAEIEPRRARLEIMAEALRTMDVDDAVANALLAMQFRPGWLEAHAATRERYVAMVRRTTATGLYRASLTVVRRDDVLAQLHNVRVPTLVTAGSCDEATPPDLARHIADAIPNAALLTFDAAHIIVEEHTDAYARAIVEHLGGRR